jgi:hypothetical protein
VVNDPHNLVQVHATDSLFSFAGVSPWFLQILSYDPIPDATLPTASSPLTILANSRSPYKLAKSTKYNIGFLTPVISMLPASSRLPRPGSDTVAPA